MKSDFAGDWTLKPLGQLCGEIYRYPSYYGIQYEKTGVPEVRPELITDNGKLDIEQQRWRFISESTSAKFPRTILEENDLVLSVRGTIGKVALVPKELEGANMTANLLRIVPDRSRLYPRYLWRFIQSPKFKHLLNHISPSTTIKTIRVPDLKALEIPLPPLPEQRRIAAILDKALAIRRKRQQAIALTEALLRSAFLEMFGDPVTNPKGWKEQQFDSFLTIPLRNGLSPSSDGLVAGKVLTLSAITGNAFKPEAAKEALFDSKLPTDRLVKTDEFLICRGNGNLTLMGRAKFPTLSMIDTAFPDTMIAARIDSDMINPSFLEMIWTTSLIRRQLEQGARTTNGTYKINQGVLRSLKVLVPPSELQSKFDQLARKVRATHDHINLGNADNLFNALVQRAFRGEL